MDAWLEEKVQEITENAKMQFATERNDEIQSELEQYQSNVQNHHEMFINSLEFEKIKRTERKRLECEKVPRQIYTFTRKRLFNSGLVSL